MNPSEEIADFLLPYIQGKVDEMRQKLIDGGVSEGSKLMQSITPDVKIYPDSVQAIISMDTNEEGVPYYEFIDKGVDGVEQSQGSPFAFKSLKVGVDMEKSLASWMKEKYGEGAGYDSERGDFYGLGVNIKKRGIKPTHFITDVLGNNILNDVSDKMVNNFGVKVFDSINRI